LTCIRVIGVRVVGALVALSVIASYQSDLGAQPAAQPSSSTLAKNSLPTLRGALRTLIPGAGIASTQKLARPGVARDDGRFAVTVRTADPERVFAALSEISRVPSNVLAEVVEVYLAADEIIELASSPVVTSIELIERSYDRVVSQGRAAHNASAWIAGGYTGAGVKVGIIDSFVGVRSLMGTELPSTIVGRCYVGIGFYTANLADCETHNDHGTAVAESLVDVAPGVTLYIANPVSKIDFNTTVAWMVAQGVKVINLSAVWPWDGPGDGSSPASDSPLRGVNSAVSGGAIFVTSAGNEGEATWFGEWNDSDGDEVHQFSGPAEDNGVYLFAGETVRLQLRWQDSWLAATIDLDLSLYNAAGTLVQESADQQFGRFGDTPFELLTYVAPATGWYSFEVNRYSGAAPTWLQVQTLASQEIEFATTAGSIGNPAETANPGALAVGAARWNSTATIESFSSLGPTPDGRVKPDVVGADGADTFTIGAFSGTSQAAPHVAGLAALVTHAFPAYTPQQVAAYLKNSAQPRGPVPNNTWGYGFAWLSDLHPVVNLSAPTNLRVSGSVGNSVTIEWTQPGAMPSGYVLEGGVAPGDVLASLPTGSPATTFTLTAPTGAFYIRVHALSGTARSAASNEIRIFVNVPAPPSAPTGLVGTANGTSLALSWVNTTAGGAPTSIELNVTGAITTTLTLPVSETFNFAGVPVGTYAFSITAVNTSGRSSPSSAVTLSFPGSCTGIVGMPTDFTAAVTGRVISLSWNPPATGGPVSDYAVIVTGSYSGTFPTTATMLSGAVVPGSYTLSVVARNACGSGPPSASQTVVVP
jgi:subtilisin family serine protease